MPARSQASRRSRRALRQTRKTAPPVPCACSTAYSRSERCAGLTMGTVRKRVFRFVPRRSTVASPSPDILASGQLRLPPAGRGRDDEGHPRGAVREELVEELPHLAGRERAGPGLVAGREGHRDDLLDPSLPQAGADGQAERLPEDDELLRDGGVGHLLGAPLGDVRRPRSRRGAAREGRGRGRRRRRSRTGGPGGPPWSGGRRPCRGCAGRPGPPPRPGRAGAGARRSASRFARPRDADGGSSSHWRATRSAAARSRQRVVRTTRRPSS